MAEAAATKNSRVYKDDGPAQSFKPWPVERVRRCVDIVRRRMQGDTSPIDEETDVMMVAFFMLHPRMARMAASTSQGDQFALEQTLDVQEEVERGLHTREEGNKILMRRLVEGDGIDGAERKPSPSSPGK